MMVFVFFSSDEIANKYGCGENFVFVVLMRRVFVSKRIARKMIRIDSNEILAMNFWLMLLLMRMMMIPDVGAINKKQPKQT